MMCPAAVARDPRWAGWLVWVPLAAALAALGWLRHADRARAREIPALGAPLVLVHGAAAGADAETWLVAVNPECAHCLTARARLAARAGPDAGAPRVGVLLVDTPRRPGPARLAALGPGPVWWDERGAWRRRWGHRLYGEVLCFDRHGRYLATRPPG